MGGRGGGGVAPRPPCSRSGRRPAVLLSGPLRVAGALPSGARVRSGLKCRPGVGGGEGRPVDRPPGAPADLNPPSVTSEWAVVTGGSCGARPPSRSVVRVAPARHCWFAGAGPAAVALTASPFLLRGGVPPRPWGAEGHARGSPAEVGGGGGGGGWGGPPPRPLSGLCGRGGGRRGADGCVLGLRGLKPKGFAKLWVHGLPLGMGWWSRGIMAAIKKKPGWGPVSVFLRVN